MSVVKILPRIKNPAKDFCYGDRVVRVCVCPSVRASVLVVNGSLDLTANSASSTTASFLFHLVIQNAATEFTVQRQMNRASGARVIRR